MIKYATNSLLSLSFLIAIICLSFKDIAHLCDAAIILLFSLSFFPVTLKKFSMRGHPVLAERLPVCIVEQFCSVISSKLKACLFAFVQSADNCVLIFLGS